MTTKNKKTSFYTALAKAPRLFKEYVKQYTQGQVDFPDELVEAFTQAQGDIKKIEQMCNNLKKSKEGAQIMKIAEQVYNAAQQEIDAEVNNETGLFKDGGKFQHLRKLAGGENIPEKDKKDKYITKRRDLNVPGGYRIFPVDEEAFTKPDYYRFARDTSSAGPVKHIVSYVYPVYDRGDGQISSDDVIGEARGQVIYEDTFGRRDTSYFNLPDYYMKSNSGHDIPVGTAPDQEAAEKLYYQFLEYVDPQDYPEVKKAKAEKHSWGGRVRNGLKWLFGKSDDIARTSKSSKIPSQSNVKPTKFPLDWDIDKIPYNSDKFIYKGSPRYQIPTYELPTFNSSNEVQKLLDDIKSEKIKLTE